MFFSASCISFIVVVLLVPFCSSWQWLWCSRKERLCIRKDLHEQTRCFYWISSWITNTSLKLMIIIIIVINLLFDLFFEIYGNLHIGGRGLCVNRCYGYWYWFIWLTIVSNNLMTAGVQKVVKFRVAGSDSSFLSKVIGFRNKNLLILTLSVCAPSDRL